MKEKKNVSKQVVWRYSSKNNTSFYSTTGSSAQRLPNGNTLVCSMNDGHFFEVAPADTSIAWEYYNPMTSDGIKNIKVDHYPSYNGVFRAYRYPASHPAIAGHDLTPGFTMTGTVPDYYTPVDLTVATNTTIHNSTVSGGATVCYNATQTITVAGSGTTFVVQNNGSATFISGQNILFATGVKVVAGGYMHGYITANGQYCGAHTSSMVTSISPDEDPTVRISFPTFSIYPNPASGMVVLEIPDIDPAEITCVRVYSMQGALMLSKRFHGAQQYRFSLEGIPAGPYVIRIMDSKLAKTIKLIKIN